MTALPMQSRDGRISAAGLRRVRQAVMAGDHVQRADVLAVITELVEARRQLADRKTNAQIYVLPRRDA